MHNTPLYKTDSLEPNTTYLGHFKKFDLYTTKYTYSAYDIFTINNGKKKIVVSKEAVRSGYFYKIDNRYMKYFREAYLRAISLGLIK